MGHPKVRAFFYGSLTGNPTSVLSGLVIGLVLSTGNTSVHGQRYQDFITTTPLRESHVLIIGFMGGWESWDNDKRGVRKLALKLRAMNFSAVHVETVENAKRRRAN